MPSFDAVNYSLRPSKSVQRQLVFDGIQKLRSEMNLDHVVYVGLGSIWFTDFILAHKVLGARDMVSIEADDIGYARAVFNAPYATLQVRHGRSSDVLPGLYRDAQFTNRPWVIWLDYDFALNEIVVADVRSVVENAPAGSIFLVTFNGHEMEYGNAADREARLVDLLGSAVPEGAPKRAYKGDRMQQTLANLVGDYMKSVAADMARPGGFVPAFHMVYKDGAPMVTVGGVLPSPAQLVSVNAVVDGRGWPCKLVDPIVVPHLTMKEALVLQAQLPASRPLDRDAVRALGFDLDEKQVAAFETYYLQYPAFAQIVA